MGLTNSKNTIDIDSLNQRLAKLEILADLNNDGIVTKDELAKYTTTDINSKKVL